MAYSMAITSFGSAFLALLVGIRLSLVYDLRPRAGLLQLIGFSIGCCLFWVSIGLANLLGSTVSIQTGVVVGAVVMMMSSNFLIEVTLQYVGRLWIRSAAYFFIYGIVGFYIAMAMREITDPTLWWFGVLPGLSAFGVAVGCGVLFFWVARVYTSHRILHTLAIQLGIGIVTSASAVALYSFSIFIPNKIVVVALIGMLNLIGTALYLKAGTKLVSISAEAIALGDR